jgi:RNA polymerase sigma factor (sigma-70 family)
LGYFFLKKYFWVTILPLQVLKLSAVNLELDELALLEGLRKNDKQSIERLYELNYPVIQSFILKNNGSADDARDVFQEAMLVLFEKVSAGNFELQSKILTYIYSVSRRIWLKKLQRMQRFGHLIEDQNEHLAVEEDLEEQQRKDEAYSQMDKALSKLGEPCKSLIEAFYIQKKHMLEIADLFGYTNADNAKNQKYKCLMRLKKLFFKEFKS